MGKGKRHFYTVGDEVYANKSKNYVNYEKVSSPSAKWLVIGSTGRKKKIIIIKITSYSL